MSTTVSSFFSRESLQRSQARSHKYGTRPPLAKMPSTQTGSLLDIILEEDLASTASHPPPPPPPVSSASSSSSVPMLNTRAQRRQARSRKDLTTTTTTTMTTTTTTAQVITPEFNVTLTNLSFNFPLPPAAASSTSGPNQWKSYSAVSSPPSMCSSLSSSPESQPATLPATPTTSDDELFLLSPSPRPLPPTTAAARTRLRRSSTIKPLVISKSQRPSTLPTIDHSSDTTTAAATTTAISHYDHQYSDDEADSDSEWYTREFSRVLTLHSTSHYPAAHRDSVSIAPDYVYEPRKRRGSRFLGPDVSAALDAFSPPPSSSSLSPPLSSTTSTTGFMSRRCTKTLSIVGPRRPPPRMSIPDDACSGFSLSMYADDADEFGFGDDDDDHTRPSPLSVYSQESLVLGDFERAQEVGLGLGLRLRREVEQDREEEFLQEKEAETVFPAEFEVQVDDGPMMLPLSLPGSPVDLEADIAHIMGTKEDGEEAADGENDALGVAFVLEEATAADGDEDDEVVVAPQPFRNRALPLLPVSTPPSSSLPAPPLPTPPPPPPRKGHSPTPSTVSSFSFPPSLAPLPSSSAASTSSSTRSTEDESDERKHGLKSKWSSSTLASVSEEHASHGASRFPGASKLKMYFQGQHKRHHSALPAPVSSSSSPKFGIFPLSPSSPLPGRKGEKSKGKKDSKGAEKKRESDNNVMVIGYHQHQRPSPPPVGRRSHESYYAGSTPNSGVSSSPRRHSPRRSYDLPMTPSGPRARGSGVKRSPSQCSASGTSDCGSEASSAYASSQTSSSGMGLRRKPIPVEMFLRSAV